MSSKKLLSLTMVAMVGALIGTVQPAKAWNLVCGITVGGGGAMKPDIINDMWEADSHALKGISLYYLAISELQRINLNKDGTFSAPMDSGTNLPVTSSATQNFQDSADEFTKALSIANKDSLGDKEGLTLLASMKTGVQQAHDAMAIDHHLPDLDQIQAIARNVMEYTSHGIALSQMHLKEGMPGHGIGGPKYKISQ